MRIEATTVPRSGSTTAIELPSAMTSGEASPVRAMTPATSAAAMSNPPVTTSTRIGRPRKPARVVGSGDGGRNVSS
jgi:hypothetical protein